MAGFELPILPNRRQVFVTAAFEPIPRPVPMILDIEPAFYFRGEGPSVLMGMSDKDEPSSFNTHVDYRFMERVIEAAVHRAPLLEQAEIVRGWGGAVRCQPRRQPGHRCPAGNGGILLRHRLFRPWVPTVAYGGAYPE
jgi:sarcosine oxidase subunit beta